MWFPVNTLKCCLKARAVLLGFIRQQLKTKKTIYRIVFRLSLHMFEFKSITNYKTRIVKCLKVSLIIFYCSSAWMWRLTKCYCYVCTSDISIAVSIAIVSAKPMPNAASFGCADIAFRSFCFIIDIFYELGTCILYRIIWTTIMIFHMAIMN